MLGPNLAVLIDGVGFLPKLNQQAPRTYWGLVPISPNRLRSSRLVSGIWRTSPEAGSLPPNAAHGIQAAARPRPTEAPALGQIDPLPEVLPGIPADDLIHLLRKRRAFDGSRKPPRIGNPELTPSLPASSVIHSVLILRFALGGPGSI